MKWLFERVILQVKVTHFDNEDQGIKLEGYAKQLGLRVKFEGPLAQEMKEYKEKNESHVNKVLSSLDTIQSLSSEARPSSRPYIK